MEERSGGCTEKSPCSASATHFHVSQTFLSQILIPPLPPYARATINLINVGLTQQAYIHATFFPSIHQTQWLHMSCALSSAELECIELRQFTALFL